MLMLNPSTDDGFARTVRELALVQDGAAGLQARLRAYYPGAIVRLRGLSGERESWYVYRDGHWIPSQPSAER